MTAKTKVRKHKRGLPSSKRLIGHGSIEDYYMDSKGDKWAYRGTRVGDWNNPAKWELLKK
jgi:hypothetical protein